MKKREIPSNEVFLLFPFGSFLNHENTKFVVLISTASFSVNCPWPIVFLVNGFSYSLSDLCMSPCLFSIQIWVSSTTLYYQSVVFTLNFSAKSFEFVGVGFASWSPALA